MKLIVTNETDVIDATSPWLTLGGLKLLMDMNNQDIIKPDRFQ
jgi:hypothetical protein